MGTRKRTAFLSGAGAFAGVVLGAGMALAAHPPVQLFTYEEVANQFGWPAMPVAVGLMGPTKGFPYSPKMTCMGGGNPAAGCHVGGNSAGAAYTHISDNSFHSALGSNEWRDTASGSFVLPDGTQTGLNKQKPWLQTNAMWGKW